MSSPFDEVQVMLQQHLIFVKNLLETWLKIRSNYLNMLPYLDIHLSTITEMNAHAEVLI